MTLFVDLPTELVLLVVQYLPLEDIRTLSRANKGLRILSVPHVFRHVKVSFARVRRLEQLCLSPYVRYVRTITYAASFLQDPDPKNTYDSIYRPFRGRQPQITLEEQTDLLEIDNDIISKAICVCPYLDSFRLKIEPPIRPKNSTFQYAWSIQRNLQVVLSAVSRSRTKTVPIHHLDLDIFNSHESIQSLHLQQCFKNALQGVRTLRFVGQHRFWETALDLDIFATIESLTLSDVTIMSTALESFLSTSCLQLKVISLDKVAVMPYCQQLGYLTISGPPAQICLLLKEMRDPTVSKVKVLDKRREFCSQTRSSSNMQTLQGLRYPNKIGNCMRG